MHDRELYSRILEISSPWEVADVELRREEREVLVRVEWMPSSSVVCPECKRACPGYDRRERRWRHLDTCQYKTILSATVPRVQCPEHGIQQVRVPWAEAGSRFTALFERLVIDWLKEASTSAVAEQFGLSWDEADGVMQRAVARGLSRREQQRPERLGIDETSFQMRHEYVTVMSDINRGIVVDVTLPPNLYQR
jgi:transposase